MLAVSRAAPGSGRAVCSLPSPSRVVLVALRFRAGSPHSLWEGSPGPDCSAGIGAMTRSRAPGQAMQRGFPSGRVVGQGTQHHLALLQEEGRCSRGSGMRGRGDEHAQPLLAGGLCGCSSASPGFALGTMSALMDSLSSEGGFGVCQGLEHGLCGHTGHE